MSWEGSCLMLDGLFNCECVFFKLYIFVRIGGFMNRVCCHVMQRKAFYLCLRVGGYLWRGLCEGSRVEYSA